jgi:hypothetical protein
MTGQCTNAQGALPCPAIAGNPNPVPGADGLCPTGAYVPTTEDEALAKPSQYPRQLSAAEYQSLVDEALGRLQPQDMGLIPSSDLTVNVVDSYIPGASTTITHVDGSTETVDTTYNYFADGYYGVNGAARWRASGHFGETVTTTTRNAQGAVTGTSTRVSGSPTPVTGSASAPAVGGGAVSIDCSATPAILACAGFGDAPIDQVPKQTVNVQYDAEDLGLPSGCPAPVTLPHGITLSFQDLCDGTVTYARPMTLLLGALLAMFIVVAGLRSL